MSLLVICHYCSYAIIAHMPLLLICHNCSYAIIAYCSTWFEIVQFSETWVLANAWIFNNVHVTCTATNGSKMLTFYAFTFLVLITYSYGTRLLLWGYSQQCPCFTSATLVWYAFIIMRLYNSNWVDNECFGRGIQLSSIHHSFQAYFSVMLSIACFGSRKLQMYKLSTNTSSVLYGRVFYWRNPLQCYIVYGIFELPSWSNPFRNFVNKSWIAEVTHRLNNWRFKWKQPFYQ